MFQRVILPFFLAVSLLAAIAMYFAGENNAEKKTTGTIVPPTIVLDAGHGGEDGGAVSQSGILEKEINLSIAKRLEALLTANGFRVVMTRTEDELLYDKNTDYQGRKKSLDLAARRKIAEETPNCIFVSIHMNSYPDARYNGLQVWYSPNNPSSKVIADTIQETIKTNLQPENDRKTKAATSAIYLLHHLTVPSVLVECGFLSNSEEAEKLNTPEYQEQLALVLSLAIGNACKNPSIANQ
ncbi:MAG: N-acetylmuramoyl-L-alanine amidase [Ruminococcaceae bacterium]|nr:N-acetylmuramoyl-L-alanine amidase [Oscillospiraceae bacterium]